MDPKACLERLADAIDGADWSEAVAALNDYYRWRVSGGFEPAGGDVLADREANRLADQIEGV